MKPLLGALLLLSALAPSAALAADSPAAPDVLTPGDNLVVEGIPPIPQSLVETAGRYGELRSASFGGWHPVRREMSITTRFADTDQIHWVKMPGGARTQLTFYPDSAFPRGVLPAGRDSLVFFKDKGGYERYQLFRYDLDSGDVTLLTDGKSRNVSLAWSNQSTRLAYVSNRRNGNDMDLWLVDATDPQTDRMVAAVQGGGWNPVDWSPDDRQVLIYEGISINDSNLWLVDAATGAKTLLTPKPPGAQIAYNNARFSRDGKGVYVTTDKDSELQRLAYLELATKQVSFLAPELRFDVDELAVSWDGKTLAFVTNEEGLGVLHLMDPRTHRELPAPKLPNGVVRNLSWHRNHHDLAFDFESDRTPSDVYSYDVTTAKLDRWTYSETGGLNTSRFAQSELIHWQTWDGKSLSGFLYRPAAKFTGKRPVMVLIHGGPEGQARPGFLGNTYYLLNELGVAVVYPNVRGSTGYGKTFMTLDDGLLRDGTYRDIASLFDWIQTQPELDAGRIVVGGGSYGGFMTLAVATNYDARIRCAVDIVGPSNLVTLLENTSGYRRDLRRVEYGDERDPKIRAYLESIAPANKAKNISKPLFVIQGYNDPRVPHTESEQMVATVRQNGTPVWYLMAKDEGHGFAKKKNLDFLYYAQIVFLQECLKEKP